MERLGVLRPLSLPREVEGHGRHEKEKETEEELTGFQSYAELGFKCSNKPHNTASSKKTKKMVFALEIVKVCLY